MQQVEVARGSSGWDSEWWGPLLVNPFPYKARYLPKKERHVIKERRKTVENQKQYQSLGELPRACVYFRQSSAIYNALAHVLYTNVNQGTGSYLPDKASQFIGY